MRLWRCALLLVLSGCGGGEDLTFGLRLLYGANPIDPGNPLRAYDGPGCSDDTVEGACLRVRLKAPTGCRGDECVDLLPPVDEGSGGDFVAGVKSGEPFKIPTASASRHDLHLEIGMYDLSGDLIASGEWRNASLNDGHDLQLTLAPVLDGTACGEPLGDSDDAGRHLRRSRAFHTATLLPNDDILVIGGVSGPIVHLGLQGNALEATMEVVHPRTGDFEDIAVENEAESTQELSRAFHQAFYVGEEGGAYVVRVVGGVRAAGSASAAVVSDTRGNTPLQLLVTGTAGATQAAAVDVVYDPSSLSATVRPALDEHPTGSFMGVTGLPDALGQQEQPGGATGGFLVGGGLGQWTDGETAASDVELGTELLLLSQSGLLANGTLAPLEVGRVGAVALPIGLDEVLFWGGNVGSALDADTTDVNEEIGEYHQLGAAAASGFVPIDVPVEIPSLTAPAFHTAVVALDRDPDYSIVVAGGYRVNNSGTVDIPVFASPLLYVVDYHKTDHTAEIRSIVCHDASGEVEDCADAFGEVAYLTSTYLSPGRVLLVGGNFNSRRNETTIFKYASRAIGAIVAVDEGSADLFPVRVAIPRYGHTATRLADASVILLGGLNVECQRPEDDGTCSAFNEPRPKSNYEVFNEGGPFPRSFVCPDPE